VTQHDYLMSAHVGLIEEQQRWALEYLVTAHDEQQIKQRRESLRGSLKEWILDNCEPDENGHKIYYFPKPVIMDDKEVRGLMAQRRVSEFVNEDKAYELVYKYNLQSSCVEEVVTEELNMDALYAANQMGIVSDDEIDDLLEQKESWALVQLKD